MFVSGNSPVQDGSPRVQDGSPRENTGNFGNVFISSLRRTSSLLFAGTSRHKTQVAPGNSKDTSADSAQHNSFHDNLLGIGSADGDSQKSSAPAVLIRTLTSEEGSTEKGQCSESGCDRDSLAESAVSTQSNDNSSSSVATLTNSGERVVLESAVDQRHSPNPAGATASPGVGEGPASAHVRHTTSSSVESDGFHSMSGEEVAAEDWSMLTKEVSALHCQLSWLLLVNLTCKSLTFSCRC